MHTFAKSPGSTVLSSGLNCSCSVHSSSNAFSMEPYICVSSFPACSMKDFAEMQSSRFELLYLYSTCVQGGFGSRLVNC